MGALLFLLITTFQPPKPTIGDPVTITFASPTTLEPSADFEVISRSGNSVVIRSFVPHTIAVNGRAADGPVSVMIPIHSVLKPDDKLEPSPLKPPKPERWPRLPFFAIGIAALAAVGAWAGVAALAKRVMTKPRIVIVPADELRRRVRSLRPDSPKRWAALADIVRAYLAAVRPDLGAELTTSELLSRIDHAAVAQILRQGDLEKFSPRGAAPADFDDAATRALEIPVWAEPPIVQAEEAA
ncbi:MAG TPA: hypothetical protein VHY33_05770 [Thermoanaerobaculia bacterium]|nr:hypothetical protein [Thermoanaerobaculia bacterium]